MVIKGLPSNSSALAMFSLGPKLWKKLPNEIRPLYKISDFFIIADRLINYWKSINLVLLTHYYVHTHYLYILTFKVLQLSF